MSLALLVAMGVGVLMACGIYLLCVRGCLMSCWGSRSYPTR